MSKPSNNLTDKAFVFVSLGAVVAAGITGFFLLGSPTEQRLFSLDTKRVDDLANISQQIWDQTGQGVEAQSEPLPDVLPRAEQRQDTYLDPKTGEPYEYQRLSDTEYELCATFARESKAGEADRYWRGPGWEHSAGRYCYQFDMRKPDPWVPRQVLTE